MSILYPLSAIMLFIFCACGLSNKEIESSEWKYGEGYLLGDWITFKKGTIRNDTIYQSNKPAGTILKSKRRLYENDLIFIQSMDSKLVGVYYRKFN